MNLQNYKMWMLIFKDRNFSFEDTSEDVIKTAILNMTEKQLDRAFRAKRVFYNPVTKEYKYEDKDK